MLVTINRISILFAMNVADIMAVISPARFSLGGSAIFADTDIIHIIEVIGVVLTNPLISIMLRELIFSYIRFVKKNIIEEVRPWVSMITSLEYCPIFEFVSVLMIISPMCPTDE